MIVASADHRSIEELAPGTSFRASFLISEEDMSTFARLSGDLNPLHTEPEFARKRGFNDKVVYGALIVARISEAVGMHLPGRAAIWTGLSISFSGPLYIGQSAELALKILDRSISTGIVELSFTVTTSAGPVAKGKIETVVRDDA